MYFKQAWKGGQHAGQYIGTLALVIFGVLLGNIPMAAVMLMQDLDTAFQPEDLFNLGIDKNLMLALVVAPFAFGLAALLFCVKYIHGRSINSVLTGRMRFDWSRVFVGFGIWIALTAAIEIAGYLSAPETYSMRPLSSSFFILLIVAFTMLPLQIAFEEVLFRGYLMQGLGRLTNTRWIPLILTSVCFGLLHMANPEVAEYGATKMMTYYIGVGLILGLIAIFDDGLELPLGMHAGTNIYAAAFVSYEAGALQTDALFHSSADISDSSIYSFLIFAGVAMFILWRIYGWEDLGKLWRPIQEGAADSELV